MFYSAVEKPLYLFKKNLLPVKKTAMLTPVL